MTRQITAAVLVSLVVVALAALAAPAAADNPPQVRSLQGQVVNDRETPVEGAVVYLKNTKTLAIKTYITEKDGNYRFNALSPNVDYEVHAEDNGKKSPTKTLSSFDTRKSAYINLKIK